LSSIGIPHASVCIRKTNTKAIMGNRYDIWIY
jgi:hypothetical protein